MQVSSQLPTAPQSRLRRAAVVGVTAAVFVSVILIRWLVLGAMGGDDHWSLWTAAAFLMGDRPFNQFVEPGDPLYWFASAMAQVLVGYRPIGELGLGLILMAVAISVSFRLAWQASGSLAVAVGLTVIVIFLVSTTKLYSYPKIFVYPLVIALAWSYIDRPSWPRALAMAGIVAVAWGYRHDHGAYVAAGVSAAALAAHFHEGMRATAFGLARAGGLTICILLPYLVLIEREEGIVDYFQERIAFAAKVDEAGRQAVPFVVDRAAPTWFAFVPPPPATVGVRWGDGLTTTAAHAAEQELGLLPAKTTAAPKTGWRRYFMRDTSRENMVALFRERYVTSVDGIVGSFRRGFEADVVTQGSARVTVLWTASVDHIRMEAVERRYRLTDRQSEAGDLAERLINYQLRDVSTENVTALQQDEAVEGLFGVHFVRIPVVIGLRERLTEGPEAVVQWVPGVSADERRELERQYSLGHARLHEARPEGEVWRYELGDPSETTVTALTRSPRVASHDALVPGTRPGTFRGGPWERPEGAPVSVIWNADLADADRERLEQQYHLRPDSFVPATLTAYSMSDASPARLAALRSDARIAEVSGVDAERLAPEGDTWLRAAKRRWGWATFTPVPKLWRVENAGVWLYYVAYLLPFVVLVILGIDRIRGRVGELMPRERQKMFAVAMLMAVANYGLLRKVGYFPDHFDATSVMGAWILGRVWVPSWRQVAGAAVAAVAVLVTSITVVAAAAFVDLPTFGTRFRLDLSLEDQWEGFVRKYDALVVTPVIDAYAPPESIGDRAVIRYLGLCTKPDDRLWITSDSYAVPYYTQRRVVGHIFWANGFMANPAFERKMIDLVEREQVPLIFGVGGERVFDNFNHYPLVKEYVSRRYTEHHAVLQDNLAGKVLWVAVDSRRRASGTYAPLGLPCFS